MNFCLFKKEKINTCKALLKASGGKPIYCSHTGEASSHCCFPHPHGNNKFYFLCPHGHQWYMAYQSNLRNKLKCPTLSPDHKLGLQSPSSPGSALVTQQHSMGNTKVPLLYTLNLTLMFPPVQSFLSGIDYLQRVPTYWTRMWQGYTLTDSHNTVHILSGYPKWKV